MDKTTFSVVLAVMTAAAACSSGGAPGPDGSDTKNDTAGGNKTGSGSSGGGTSGGGTAHDGGAGGGSSGGADAGFVVNGASSGACANASDEAVVSVAGFKDKVADCAQTNFGAEPGTKSCIKAFGISDACTTCFDDEITCVVTKCVGECLSDANSAACISCRGNSCDPAFLVCSGFKAQ